MEVMKVINIINKNTIIVKYTNGMGIKTIARELGLSKNTVKKYIREYEGLCVKLNNSTSKEQ